MSWQKNVFGSHSSLQYQLRHQYLWYKCLYLDLEIEKNWCINPTLQKLMKKLLGSIGRGYHSLFLFSKYKYTLYTHLMGEETFVCRQLKSKKGVGYFCFVGFF